MGSTLAGIGLLAVVSILSASHLVVAGILLVVGVLVIAPTAIRDRYGRHLGTRVSTWVRWRLGAARAANVYRSGPLSRVPDGKFLLPGLAIRSDVWRAQDALGRPFAMLHYPDLDHFVVVIACSARGGDLVDASTSDSWVAEWGDFQRKMGLESGLLGYEVVVETAPDSGHRVRAVIDAQRSPLASPLAEAVMEHVKDSVTTATLSRGVQAGSSQKINTWVALTYSPSNPARKRDFTVAEMAVMLGQRLPLLTQWLAPSGAGFSRPVTAEGLAETARLAYDPALSAVMDQARADGGSGLSWDQAGPLSHVAAWDHLRHDSGVSASWVMGEAPRGEVFSTVLRDLLQPHPDIDRKRVAMVYRPHSAAEAPALVEKDVRAARSGVASARSDKSRREAESAAAQRSATEEAAGAGLTRFGLLATATVRLTHDVEQDEERIAIARQAMENLSAESRIALRPAFGCQDGVFLAALPLGVILPEYQKTTLTRRTA